MRRIDEVTARSQQGGLSKIYDCHLSGRGGVSSQQFAHNFVVFFLERWKSIMKARRSLLCAFTSQVPFWGLAMLKDVLHADSILLNRPGFNPR